MVELGSAVRENSSRVELPRFGINSDRYWLLLNSVLKIRTVSRGDICELGDLEKWCLDLRLLAGSGDGLVWVVRFRGDTVLDNVLESVIHQSSVASHISEAGRAVNQLLFREVSESRLLDEIVRFQRSGG